MECLQHFAGTYVAQILREAAMIMCERVQLCTEEKGVHFEHLGKRNKKAARKNFFS